MTGGNEKPEGGTLVFTIRTKSGTIVGVRQEQRKSRFSSICVLVMNGCNYYIEIFKTCYNFETCMYLVF